MPASFAEEFKTFFNCYDGSKNWEDGIKLHVERLHHPDVKVVANDGEIDRLAMINFVRKFTLEGGKAEEFKICELWYMEMPRIIY